MMFRNTNRWVAMVVITMLLLSLTGMAVAELPALPESLRTLVAEKLSGAVAVKALDHDINRDGAADTVLLATSAKAAQAGSADKLYIAAVNGINGEWMGSYAIPTGSVRLSTLRLEALATESQSYVIAGGMTTSASVECLVADVLTNQNGTWKSLFGNYMKKGLSYQVGFRDGPVVELSLGTGQVVTLKADKAEYQANGWADASGKISKSLGRGFGENTGFSHLSWAMVEGKIVLTGQQDVRGAHKLDLVARINTTWRYDGSQWNIDANVTPVGKTSLGETTQSNAWYYNADGGKYYHANPSCPSVSAKYLPLKSFPKGELQNSPYRNLQPCPQCVQSRP